jgi:hypothetical protein
MRKYSDIPELLEQFMEEHGTDERWLTVHELRDRFGLTRYQCNTVSGFLRRLEYATFGRFPFIVLRIEQAGRTHPSDPPKYRYLVKRKGQACTAQSGTPVTPEMMNCTGFLVFVHSSPITKRLKAE